jgi:hypothetical protein
LELTIETAGKRGIRIAQARRAAEAARWQIWAAAWNVRSRLRGALLEVYAAGEMEVLLADQEKFQAEFVRILEIEKEAERCRRLILPMRASRTTRAGWQPSGRVAEGKRLAGLAAAIGAAGFLRA